MKTTSPKQKGMKLKQSQNAGHTTCDAVEEASMTAAYLIAEAENKSFVAAEAVKEAERVSKMAEDTDSLLQLAKEIFETCNVFPTLHFFFSNSRVWYHARSIYGHTYEDITLQTPLGFIENVLEK